MFWSMLWSGYVRQTTHMWMMDQWSLSVACVSVFRKPGHPLFHSGPRTYLMQGEGFRIPPVIRPSPCGVGNMYRLDHGSLVPKVTMAPKLYTAFEPAEHTDTWYMRDGWYVLSSPS
jgi:hypothetical protein